MAAKFIRVSSKITDTLFKCPCPPGSGCNLPSAVPQFCHQNYESLMMLPACPICNTPMELGTTSLFYSCQADRLYKVCSDPACAAVFTVITHQAGLKRRDQLAGDELVRDWLPLRTVDQRILKWRDEVAAEMERPTTGALNVALRSRIPLRRSARIAEKVKELQSPEYF